MKKPDEFTSLAFKNALLAMIQRLNAWAAKPEANHETIKQREQEITALAEYYNQAEEIFNQRETDTRAQTQKLWKLEKENKELRNILFLKGTTTGDIPHYKADQKEITRSLSINRALSVWPELY